MLHRRFANVIQVSVEVEEHENQLEYLTPTYFKHDIRNYMETLQHSEKFPHLTIVPPPLRH